jgi:hypothetical protein
MFECSKYNTIKGEFSLNTTNEKKVIVFDIAKDNSNNHNKICNDLELMNLNQNKT